MKIKNLLLSIILFTSLQLFAQQNYRPKYHYTPPKNWVNDPNGLIYLDGEYHIFTQHNPFGDKWGHMSWGHAVSKDLVNWQELPLALPEYINKEGKTTMIFSGCAVVDSLNTSGFFKKGFKKGLVAVFTSHVHEGDKGIGQQQSIAYSSDKGRTWKYFDNNPVLDIGLPDFRDPNIIWYPERKVWIMSVVKPLEFLVQFYKSTDFKKWEFMSEFGKTGDLNKIWECPSLVKVPVSGSKSSKWMLMLSCANRNKEYVGMQYWVGDFDGKKFTSQRQPEPLYIDEGKDFYAAIPFYNLPKTQINPIMIAWASNWAYANDTPTSPYRCGYTLGRKMAVYYDNGTYKLSQLPVVSGVTTQTFSLKKGQKLTTNIGEKTKNVYRIILDINLLGTNGFVLELMKSGEEKTILSYDLANETLTFDKTKSGNIDFNKSFAVVDPIKLKPINNHVKLDILVDKSIIEMFVNDGKLTVTEAVYPVKNGGGIELVWK